MNEPDIIVNGVPLTQGQAMTVRVALQAYAMQMSKKNALGKDEVGEGIRRGYLKCIGEINQIIAT